MLYRKIINKIKNWYLNNNKALLIDGARQVGKTTIIREFIKQNNIDYLELNLLENKDALEAFNSSSNSKELLFRLSLIANRELKPNKTIIFIDEIQEANDAITPIKFLVDNSTYRYIFSGSLLGVKMQEIASIPVGYIEFMQMYPLDFEEFIIALGITKEIIKKIEESFNNRTPVDSMLHNKLMQLFNLYLLIGGMPQVVKQFITTKDITNVNKELSYIDSAYKKDVTKYNKNEKFQIQDIYDLIPSELNSQNKRFILKELNEKKRFYYYEESFMWLKNSGVALFVYNVDNPIYPLLASKKRTLFKLFYLDVGLLSHKLFKHNQISIINGDTNLNYGAIYEAFVAQQLTANDVALFYNSSKKNGEIDFLIELNNQVIPIEVKSGKDYKRHSALNNLLNNKDYPYAYILCKKNIEIKDKKIYLPIYMTLFIKEKICEHNQIINIDFEALKKLK